MLWTNQIRNRLKLETRTRQILISKVNFQVPLQITTKKRALQQQYERNNPTLFLSSDEKKKKKKN